MAQIEKSVYEVRALCIKNNWFTNGNNTQYGMMFDRVAEHAEIEEIGVLLLNPSEQTRDVAERLRRIIRAVPAVEQITMSIGVSYYGQDGTSWGELFNNADKALYYAKANGKDQVVEYHNIP